MTHAFFDLRVSRVHPATTTTNVEWKIPRESRTHVVHSVHCHRHNVFVLCPPGGVCWLNMVNSDNSMCSTMIDTKSTFDECCGSNSRGAGFTEGDFNQGDIFRMNYLQTNNKCQACMSKTFTFPTLS